MTVILSERSESKDLRLLFCYQMNFRDIPLFPIPYSLIPIPNSLFPSPYSLVPIPYSRFPIP